MEPWRATGLDATRRWSRKVANEGGKRRKNGYREVSDATWEMTGSGVGRTRRAKGRHTSEFPDGVKAGAFARIQATDGQGVDGPGRKTSDGRAGGEILRDGSGKGRYTPGPSAGKWDWATQILNGIDGLDVGVRGSTHSLETEKTVRPCYIPKLRH